ncbi:MAG: histidine kinase [Cyclobacteriaceae bacterium]
MLKNNEIIKDFIIYPVLLAVIGGFVQGVLFCDDCWDNTDLLIQRFAYQGSFWGIFTLGSQIAIHVSDYFVKWLDAPVTRFLLGLGLMLVITSILFLANLFFFQVVIFDNSYQKVWEWIDIGIFISPILITFAVNTFFHGREFLLAWRQNSINYERLKTEQIATQYDSLKNQVNPHFLFNSLNALTSLVYDDQEKAVEFIRKLSQVYRYVLDTKDNEVVKISEELGFLNSYMYLQKIRFEENLTFQIDLSNEVKALYTVPISLQMLLENAIKHNIVSQSKPLHILITYEDDYLIISNNLQEKMHKDSTGIGLTNIRDRFSYMTSKPVVIEKTDTKFTVKLPLIKAIN